MDVSSLLPWLSMLEVVESILMYTKIACKHLSLQLIGVDLMIPFD
jgi:hypothetical protein